MVEIAFEGGRRVSAEPGSVLTTPMRGRAAWHRTLEARERYLAAGDPDRLPAQAGEVRREIAMSWRRSLLSGVDTASTDLPRDTNAVPPIYRKLKRLGITR
jgi:hypothetical protein